MVVFSTVAIGYGTLIFMNMDKVEGRSLLLCFGGGSLVGHELGTAQNCRAEELMLLNCGVGEDSLESLGLQGDPTSPS